MLLHRNGFKGLIPNMFIAAKESVSFSNDKNMVQIGSADEAWLWIAIEPIHKQILEVYISRHRNMIVAESLLRSLVKVYGKDTASIV